MPVKRVNIAQFTIITASLVDWGSVDKSVDKKVKTSSMNKKVRSATVLMTIVFILHTNRR